MPTSDQPVKIRSIPINIPMIHRLEIGHCAQTMIPRIKLIMPLVSVQPHPGIRAASAATMRKMPATVK